MAVIPRTSNEGFLRPALGALELSQSLYQGVPLSLRKGSGLGQAGTGAGTVTEGSGLAAFFQLPHVTDSVVKKITRKVCNL